MGGDMVTVSGDSKWWHCWWSIVVDMTCVSECCGIYGTIG